MESSLATIARVLAMSVIRNDKREEQIGFLHSVGYTPGTIAEILNVPANNVSVTLYQLKKKQTTGRRSKK